MILDNKKEPVSGLLLKLNNYRKSIFSFIHGRIDDRIRRGCHP